MKKLIALYIAVFSLIAGNSTAQSIDNAYLFSSNDLLGSARYVAMGGAFGALGANQSSTYDNPAGIGVYRRSEFALTLGGGNTSTQSGFMGSGLLQSNDHFGIDNIGLVNSMRDDDFVRGNYGVFYNKTNLYSQEFTVEGEDGGSSLLDVFTSQANGTHVNDLYDNYYASAGLVWDAYLINNFEDDSTAYFTEIPYGDITKSKRVNRSGRKGESTIAGGVNIDNKTYIGFSMGFPTVTFRESYTYTESGLDDELELLGYDFKEDLLVTGTGINLKAGVIIQAKEWLRLGAAYHSPNWMSMDGSFNREVRSTFIEGSYQSVSPEILYSYRLRTPSKYQLNSAVIIGKIALIAADYEFVNFNAMKLRDAAEPIFDQDYSAENDAIKSAYRGTHNFKVGGELRIAKYFALRGGFNYRQAPYESEVALTDAQVITYTGGFGFRKHSFYLDVAASYSDQNQDYYMYQGVDPASLNTNRQRLMCTIGYRY